MELKLSVSSWAASAVSEMTCGVVEFKDSEEDAVRKGGWKRGWETKGDSDRTPNVLVSKRAALTTDGQARADWPNHGLVFAIGCCQIFQDQPSDGLGRLVPSCEG